MKKIVLMLFIVNVFAISCNTNESEVFESEKLRGKYKVDLTPFVAETVKSEEGDNKWTKMGKGLAGLALSSIDIEFSFYDNNKGIMYIDGGLIVLLML